MTLSDYLATDGETATRLAASCECAVSTITRAAKGEITPSLDLMRRIFENTNGAVTPNDWLGIAA